MNIPPGDVFMHGVQSGSWLRIEALDNTFLIQFSLSGANVAIGQSVQGGFP